MVTNSSYAIPKFVTIFVVSCPSSRSHWAPLRRRYAGQVAAPDVLVVRYEHMTESSVGFNRTAHEIMALQNIFLFLLSTFSFHRECVCLWNYVFFFLFRVECRLTCSFFRSSFSVAAHGPRCVLVPSKEVEKELCTR